MKIYFKSLVFLVTVFAVTAIISCGGSGGGESGGINPPSADLTGEWQVTENGSDCEGSYNDNYAIDVSQSGNNISFIYDSSTVSGTISGNTVTWQSTFPNDGGTVVIKFNGTVSSDGNTVTGKTSWTWTDGTSSCSGTSDLTATKISEPVPPGTPADVNGTWNGAWQSAYGGGISGIFTAVVVQNDTVLSGTIDVPYIGMSGATLEGTVNGSNMTFGDISGYITFSGTVSGNSASGTFVYYLGISGTWTAGKQAVIP